MTDTKKHLTHLETVGLIRLAKAYPELEFIFRHALVQEAAYNSLLFADRKKLHRKVAEAMEEAYPDRLDELAAELARHYTEAGDEEKAVAYLLRAGDHSRQLVAMNDAIGFYRAVLERLPESNQPERAETLDKLGECQFLISLYYEAIKSFMTSENLFEALGNRKRVAAAERKIGEVYWEIGETEISLQYCHRALTILEQGPESIELARALNALSRLHMLSDKPNQAIAFGERALALAGRLNAKEVTAHALNNVGYSYVLLGDAEHGLAMLQDSLSRALALGLPYDTLRANINLGFAFASVGRYEEARNAFESTQVYAMEINSIGFFDSASVPLTQLDWLLGQWRSALVRCQTLFERFRDPQLFNVTRIWASSLLGQIYNDSGQSEAARQALESMLPSSRQAQITLPHLAQLLRAYTALGRASEADEIGREFLEWIHRDTGISADLEGALPFLVICQSLSTKPNQTRLEDAYVCLHQLELAQKQLGTSEIEAYLNEGGGSIALAEDNPSQAVEQFRDAVAGWGQLGRPYDQARALKYLGQALAQSGDTDEARDAFQQAFAIIETLAAQLDDAELKDSFLNSPLVREIQVGLEA